MPKKNLKEKKKLLSDFRKGGSFTTPKSQRFHKKKIGVVFSLKVSEKGAFLKEENTDGLPTLHWNGGTGNGLHKS